MTLPTGRSNSREFRLLMEFCESFLGLPQGSIVGIQEGFTSDRRSIADQILFNVQDYNDTTLCVPVSTLLLPEAAAREVVLEKIRRCRMSFERGEANAQAQLAGD
jgi:hypothetical protein